MKDLTGTTLGGYHLKTRIGRGGMSMVYRASRGEDTPDVAVKVMDTAADTVSVFLQRFQQEAKIVEDMSHPNILPLLDYGHDQDYPYMVMPLMTGGTLADIIRKNPLSQDDTGGWLYQIAMALDHAHSRGVVHRDLKPTNILLDDQGHAYLTDFGIAKLLTITSSMTMTGNVVGTPTYMAPEQWRGAEATPLTDVYGLGVLVYLMLTGQPPFKADTPHALMYKHLNEPPPAMSIFIQAIKPRVNKVIAKALAKDTSERYRSASEFSQDYQRALHELETLAERQPPSTPKRTGSTMAIDAYRTPASVAVPKPMPGDVPQSIPSPYNPNVLQPMPVYAPAQRRPLFSFRSCLLSLVLAVVLIGIGLEVNRNPDEYLPRTLDMRVNEDVPSTPTNDPTADIPQIEVLTPAQSGVFGVENPVSVQVFAQDSQEITKVELRRFGYVLETLNNVSGGTSFQVTVEYEPRQAGTHLLEFIPYRGDVAGNSVFFRIQAQ